MLLRDLTARIGLDFDGKGFKQAGESILHLNAGFELLGKTIELGRLALDTFVLSNADLADQLEATAQRTGLSTDTIQALGYAADQSNISGESLIGSLKFLSNNLGEAVTGGKTAQAAFTQLGLSFEALAGMPVDQALGEVADKIAGISSPALQTKAAMDIFGRAGAEIIPVLRQGSAGLAQFGRQFKALGGGLTDTEIGALTKFNDSLDDLSVSFNRIKADIGGQLLPVFADLIGKAQGFYTANRQIITSGIAEFFKSVGSFAQNVGEGLTTLFRGLDGLQGPLAVIAALFLAWSFPVAFVFGILALLFEDITVWSKGGKSAIGDVIGPFEDWREEVDLLTAAWNLLKAIIVTTFELAVKGVNEATKGVSKLVDLFFAVKDATKEQGGAILTGIAGASAPVTTQQKIDELGGGILRGFAQSVGLGAAPTDGGRSTSASATNNVTVNVNAGGMDAASLGGIVGQEVLRAMEAANREAFHGLVPAGAP